MNPSVKCQPGVINQRGAGRRVVADCRRGRVAGAALAWLVSPHAHSRLYIPFRTVSNHIQSCSVIQTQIEKCRNRQLPSCDMRCTVGARKTFTLALQRRLTASRRYAAPPVRAYSPFISSADENLPFTSSADENLPFTSSAVENLPFLFGIAGPRRAADLFYFYKRLAP
ncbi:hypothetical protein EVAR_55328_1 [Eumeta japonica]|uniref:Uncharacterized protein n=1 Tax=Eumeta variegata TaxID=151549 RepID=A0A4C1ZBX8_EUMVA|nr:hypothetical protein EVAR_55328_1 [Eumeta japonica]